MEENHEEKRSLAAGVGSGLIKAYTKTYSHLPVAIGLTYFFVVLVAVLSRATDISWLGGLRDVFTLNLSSPLLILLSGVAIFWVMIILSMAFWGIGGFAVAAVRGLCDGAMLASVFFIHGPALDPFGVGEIGAFRLAVLAFLAFLYGFITMIFFLVKERGCLLGIDLLQHSQPKVKHWHNEGIRKIKEKGVLGPVIVDYWVICVIIAGIAAGVFSLFPVS